VSRPCSRPLPTGRGEAVALLERAEAITGDADATHQELVRARELSERALDRLGLADGGEPDEDADAAGEHEAREARVDAAEKRATSADATEGGEASADGAEDGEMSVDTAEEETNADGTGTTRT
jgi:hypothetical protein